MSLFFKSHRQTDIHQEEFIAHKIHNIKTFDKTDTSNSLLTLHVSA